MATDEALAAAVASAPSEVCLHMVTSLQEDNAADEMYADHRHQQLARERRAEQGERQQGPDRKDEEGIGGMEGEHVEELEAADERGQKVENAGRERRRLKEKTASSSVANGITEPGAGMLVTLRKEENLIPKEALLYTPTSEEIYKPVGRGQFVRLIFGDLPLTPFEKGEVAKVKQALKNDPRVFQNTVFADDHFVVRFLQGNDWDVAKCVEDMHQHLQWRKTHLPVAVSSVAPLLARGYCYIFGRDRSMRPIVIIRCKEFINAEPETVVRVLLFWLEFAVRRLLVKDRVDQWRVLVDLDECSAFRAPIGTLKDIADNLMRNYRGRLAQMLIVNSGFFFWSVWQLLSVVLPERTKQKIVLYTTNYQADLFSHVRRNQVEARYGGTCPNVTEFDVVRMPQGPYY